MNRFLFISLILLIFFSFFVIPVESKASLAGEWEITIQGVSKSSYYSDVILDSDGSLTYVEYIDGYLDWSGSGTWSYNSATKYLRGTADGDWVNGKISGTETDFYIVGGYAGYDVTYHFVKQGGYYFTYYLDNDGDGFGNPNLYTEATSQPNGYVSNNTDCNDLDSNVYPGAAEIRGDGIDQDCNGLDLPYLITYYHDNDGDTYGDPDVYIEAETQPEGYVTNNTDCNDYDSSINPDATEITGDGIDQDCDGCDMDTQHLVTQIYVATFGRAPANAGLNYWADSVDTGSFTIEQVAQSFFDQPETKAIFPEGSSNSEFITAIYYNVLNRAPAESGLAYWVDALDSGTMRRDQAIMAIINGAKSATGDSDDAAMLAKKTEIGVYFAESDVGSMTDNESFMDWANNIINFSASDDFNIEEAEDYIVELLSDI